MAATASYSDQSQWALIWRQFRRRKLAVLCAGIILGLITISIFAPFLANDRPLYYRGINRFEYREAVRTLREVIGRLAESKPGSLTPAARNDLLVSMRLQGRLMGMALSSEDSAKALALVEEASTAANRTEGADALREIRARLQKDFGRRDIALVSSVHWPIVQSLSGLDIAFLMANVILLGYPFWSRLLARVISEEHRLLRYRVNLLIWVALPLTAGGWWWMAVPSRIDRTNYKAGVLAADAQAASAPVVYEAVVWPPIAFAIDEDDLAQKFAPPVVLSKAGPSLKSSPWDGPHWLGTDEIGRDVLSRMIWGGRVSLSVGVVAVSIYVTIGIIVGAVAGYFRGLADLVISRIIEVVICFPAFFLILTIVAFVGPSILNIMIVIGLTGWTGIARLVRGEFLRLVDQEFVLAGRALGYTPSRLIFRHILPNAAAPALISATFGIAGAILTESSLSFLGLGISAPTPSWGGMLTSGREALFRAPWLIWYPGLAIFVTISCYNLVGEALRDASDPRLRGSR